MQCTVPLTPTGRYEYWLHYSVHHLKKRGNKSAHSINTIILAAKRNTNPLIEPLYLQNPVCL
jgi:hypothetical protein